MPTKRDILTRIRLKLYDTGTPFANIAGIVFKIRNQTKDKLMEYLKSIKRSN